MFASWRWNPPESVVRQPVRCNFFWVVGSKATYATISYTLDLRMWFILLQWRSSAFLSFDETQCSQRESRLPVARSVKIVFSFPFFFAHAITLDILLCHVSTSHLVIMPQILPFIVSPPKSHLARSRWQLNREILKLWFVSPTCPVMKSGSIEVGGRGTTRQGPDVPTTISRHTRHTWSTNLPECGKCC